MKSPSKKQEQNDDPAAAEEAAVLAAAISFVSTKMTRLEGTVETAKINVQDSIAKASADASAGDPDACAEPQGMDILSLDPSSIDVEFIEKATSLPQEILDEVPPGLRQFMGRPDDRKALMAFKRQRTKEIRRIIQAVWYCVQQGGITSLRGPISVPSACFELSLACFFRVLVTHRLSKLVANMMTYQPIQARA